MASVRAPYTIICHPSIWTTKVNRKKNVYPIEIKMARSNHFYRTVRTETVCRAFVSRLTFSEQKLDSPPPNQKEKKKSSSFSSTSPLLPPWSCPSFAGALVHAQFSRWPTVRLCVQLLYRSRFHTHTHTLPHTHTHTLCTYTQTHKKEKKKGRITHISKRK